MNFARCKPWLRIALLGLFAFTSAFATAIPTAQADHYYHNHYRGGVVVVHPGYHYGYHRHVHVYGGGPRVIVAPAPHYYYYGRHHRYEHHYGPYYRY